MKYQCRGSWDRCKSKAIFHFSTICLCSLYNFLANLLLDTSDEVTTGYESVSGSFRILLQLVMILALFISLLRSIHPMSRNAVPGGGGDSGDK